MNDTVVPYTGLDQDMVHDQRVLSGEIQEPLRMPQKFDAVFDGEGRIRKPAADFNQETLRNLDETYKELEQQPPYAAVVVNFHPLMLRVNGGRHFFEGVPACTPDKSVLPEGRQCSAMVLYEAALDPVPQDSGNHTFGKILPIWKAQAYMNVANGNPELWGIGAFVFEASLDQLDKAADVVERQMRKAGMWDGTVSPDEVAYVLACQMWDTNPEIKTFDDTGTPKFMETGEVIKQRRARGIVSGRRRVPVMAKYRDVYMDVFTRRNEGYLAIYKRINSDWLNTDPQKRKNVGINGMSRDQAQTLLNLGLILEPPQWLTPTTEGSGISSDKCGYCSANVKIGTVMCAECNWPVDVYRAGMEGKISVEHAALDDLSEDQLAEVIQADAERKAKRARAMGRVVPVPDVKNPVARSDGQGQPNFASAMKAARERKRQEREADAAKSKEPTS